MLESMTGYGKAIVQLDTKKVSIEIKSLNSKNLDLNTRFPALYKEKEIEVRKILSTELVRGKVELMLFLESTADTSTSRINIPVVQDYISQLREVGEHGDLLEAAMRLPDVLKTEREELDEGEWKEIESGIREGIAKLKEFRKNEGMGLLKDFNYRIGLLQNKLEEVMTLDPERIESLRAKLQRAIDEIEQQVDENRFEQELIYYLEKLDITEEKVRLNNHLTYFDQELNNDQSNGKKLGFISQEIGREINTIGSKANYAPMQKIVVEMKDELEKIKEQLLNVL